MMPLSRHMSEAERMNSPVLGYISGMEGRDFSVGPAWLLLPAALPFFDVRPSRALT